MVNESNLTPRNAFLVDFFALGGEKELKYDGRTLFWDSLHTFDLSFVT